MSQEILSPSRLEELISRFDLYAHLRTRSSPEELVQRMRGDIRLEPKAVEREGQRATVTFALSYRGTDPQKVAHVTNTLASFYIEGNVKVRERMATGTTEFLRVKLEETKGGLDRQERRLSDFKRRHLGELPQQMETNLTALERLQTQLRVNNDNQTRALGRKTALEKQLAHMAPAVNMAPAPAAVAMPDPRAARLTRLREELTELRSGFGEKYPDVVRLKGEIAALERQVAETKPSERLAVPERQLAETKPSERLVPQAVILTDPYVRRLEGVLEEVDGDLKMLKEEEKRLRAAIATYQQRVENAPWREQEYQELFRDYESTRELYQSLLKRYEEAHLAESMEQRQKGEQFRILNPARPAGEPVAPKRPRLVLMAFLLSAGLAAGVMVLAERLDTSFHSVEDLRRFTPVPVLASIPLIVTEAAASRRRTRLRLAAMAALLGAVLVVFVSYFVASGNEQLVSLLSRGA